MITIIVAVAKNGVIGCHGSIPWHLKHDMARFKKLTMGDVVVMGRKTWESLPRKPLPGRQNVVVTRNQSFEAPGANIATSIENALNVAGLLGANVYIIGGEEIFKEALEYADRVLVTLVEAEPEGDTFFTEVLRLDPKKWWLVSASTDPLPKDGQPTSEFRWYHKVS